MSCVRLRLELAMEQQKRQLRELFRDADSAKARLAELNEWIYLLARSGMVDGHVAIGNEVLCLSYKPCEGGHDSGPCYQGAILIPEGLGVIQMDSDSFVSLQGITEGIEANAHLHFIPLLQCRPVVQQWLLPQIDTLIEKLSALLPAEMRSYATKASCALVTTHVCVTRHRTQ